jgi:hypothetical protein
MMLARDVSFALYGAWRLVRLDRTGLAFFDRSPAGYWRSLWVLLFNVPAGLIISALYRPKRFAESEFIYVALVEASAQLISLLAIAAIVHLIATILDREERWLDFIIAYNWTQAPVMALILGIAGLHHSGILPGATGSLVLQAVLIGWYFFCGWLARNAMGLPMIGAVAVALSDFVLSEILGRVVDAAL